MDTVSIILPTYNERDTIEPLITRLFNALPDAEVIVVDDDSPDGTWHIAQALQPKHPRLKVHRRLNERGLTTAIQAGIDLSTGDLVGWLDCDLSMPPAVFTRMIPHFETADFVLGSRYVSGGKDDRPFLRRLSSLIICTTGRIFLGTATKDLTSGFILCRRTIVDAFPLKGYYGEYCIELIFRAERHNFTVKEIPYHFTDRAIGESKTFPSMRGFLRLGMRYLTVIARLSFERISSSFLSITC
ncbi:MAG: polyprenol monophosphomannose synthase [Deltaproteobacteria bacterium]|nr:polyprenol monophosphomannose synthase [Deltaproteobacteria bacterium]